MTNRGCVPFLIPYGKKEEYIEQQIVHSEGSRCHMGETDIITAKSNAMIGPAGVGKSTLLKKFKLVDGEKNIPFIMEMTGLQMEGLLGEDKLTALSAIFNDKSEYDKDQQVLYVPSGGVSLKSMTFDQTDGFLIMNILRGCIARLHIMTNSQNIRYSSNPKIDDLLYNPVFNIGDLGDYGFVEGVVGQDVTDRDDSELVSIIVGLLLDKIETGGAKPVIEETEPESGPPPPPPPPEAGDGPPPPPPPPPPSTGSQPTVVARVPVINKEVSPFEEQVMFFMEMIERSTKSKKKGDKTSETKMDFVQNLTVGTFKKNLVRITSNVNSVDFFTEMYQLINSNFDRVSRIFVDVLNPVESSSYSNFSLFKINDIDDLKDRTSVEACFERNNGQLKIVTDKLIRHLNDTFTTDRISVGITDVVMKHFSMNDESISRVLMEILLPTLLATKNNEVDNLYRLAHLAGVRNVAEGEIAIFPYTLSRKQDSKIVKFRGPMKAIFEAFKTVITTYDEEALVIGGSGLFSLRSKELNAVVTTHILQTMENDKMLKSKIFDDSVVNLLKSKIEFAFNIKDDIEKQFNKKLLFSADKIFTDSNTRHIVNFITAIILKNGGPIVDFSNSLSENDA